MSGLLYECYFLYRHLDAALLQWSPERDSNPHDTLGRRLLRPLWLPITSSGVNMTRQYRTYTDADVTVATKEVKSLSGLLKKLGLRAAGGNFVNMKRIIQRLNLDTSHWTGKGWTKDQQLKDWSDYTSVRGLKPHLIKERGHCCELCLNSEWMDYPIALEVHHVDGDRTHNDRSNLQLLCPNCHAMTDNWRGRVH